MKHASVAVELAPGHSSQSPSGLSPKSPSGLSFPALDSRNGVLLALAAMALVWAVAISFFYPSPPWDNVEELFWAGSFELGYYKHPPLPSWIMGVLVGLAGREPWLTYAAGVACGVGALFIVWQWSREMVVPRRAALALVLGTLVTYHVQRAVIYNHNTVQLIWLAGYWWMLWRVLRGPSSRYRDWVCLGAFAALAFLTKYSAVVQFAVGLAFIVRQGLWREAHVRTGVAIAGAVALAMLLPHFAWMVRHPDLSIAYALHSVHSKTPAVYSYNSLRKVVTLQIVRLLPMVLMAACLWLTRARGGPASLASPTSPTSLAASAFDRRFLAWASFGPVCAVLPLAAVFQVTLLPAWLTTFFLPVALWAVVNLRGLDAEHWSRLRWRVVMAVTVVVHLVGALGQGWVEGVWSRQLGYMTRPNLPAQDVALAVNDLWQRRVGDAPLQLLVGDTWFAGAVALKMAPSMQLLVDGQERDSPWLAPGTLAREGGMVLILDNPDFLSEGIMLEPLLASANCRGVLNVPWTGQGAAHSARIRWGIVLPAGRAAHDTGQPARAC